MTSGINYGGSIQHRFSDVTSKHESRPGTSVNLHSRISICSDNLGKYARGMDNYPIVFQFNYLYALCSISHHILFNKYLLKTGNVTYHQHFLCPPCLPILNEVPMSCQAVPPPIQVMKDCPLVFSSLVKDLCEMPINCLANVARMEPNPTDPNIMRLSAHAAALVIIGEMSNLSIPILQSGLKYQHREGNLICLTVGLFMKIDLRLLFERIMIIWVLDNLEEILTILKGYQVDIEEAVEILLERVPDKSWELLKPYLCLTEVQQELILRLDCMTTSSEAFVRGKGLGYLVNSLILSQFKRAWGRGRDYFKKVFKFPFITTTPSISLTKAFYLWVNSCVLMTQWESNDQLWEIYQLAQDCLFESIGSFGLDAGRLGVSIYNISVGDRSIDVNQFCDAT